MIAASTTEPPVGASTCASGSQVCTGNIGILTAKPRKNAKNSHICSVAVSDSCTRSGICQLPPFMYRSEEHTSELQSLMRIPYAVSCLKKKYRVKSNKHI